ncbi:hypothetical protein KK083_20250 [Fulvivirgaceae bacterium PWU4]|uniref:Uncharacterized protein n=1 Tax=Chryseosolibacter histidini TaxID=2782349 RepID=A0AAP2DMS6_9BACT|nr:hypothetical protein [Chryseosolibacter histidini]MBT1699240.1 hypothetical protein [Chryseosolibacter histidini]
MKKFTFIMVVWLNFLSCRPSDGSPSSDTRFYSDIELFTLEGVNEMLPSELKYPYIQIDFISENKRDITYYFDKNTVYSRKYERRDSIWSSLHKVIDAEEGATFYFYEYISANWRMVLEYKNDPRKNGSLSTLTLLDRQRKATYVFEEDMVRIKPSSDIGLYPLRRSLREELYDWNIHEGILMLNETYINTQTREIEYKGRKCYHVGSLSYFWWTMAGHKLAKVDCAN